MAQRVSSFLTTGQAAKLCEVTPDTILKWIRKGRLSGTRTAGGHYRINLRDLEPHIPPGRDQALSPRTVPCTPQTMRCWEYLSNRGVVRNSCKKCVVYRVGATGCFLMAGIEPEIGHARRFCETSCEECVYYRRVNGLATNVLVISSDEVFVGQLASEEDENLTMRFASGAYDASAIIQSFRPAFAVVDGQLLATQEGGLLDSLAGDSRVPGLKVILVQPAGGTERMRREPNNLVVRVLERPLRLGEILDVISSFPVDSLPPEDGDPSAGARKGRPMIKAQAQAPDRTLDEDGFLQTMSNWNRSKAEELAEKNDIGPLTEDHWKIIEFVKTYFETYRTGPAVVKIAKATGLSRAEICKLFPCGVVRGAYRLAGLPRPPGCF